MKAFVYHVQKPSINGVNPADSGGAAGGTTVTISGAFFPSANNAQVKFGTLTAFVNLDPALSNANQLTVTAPPTSAAPPTCTGGNPANTNQVVSTVDITVTDAATTCFVIATGAFQYTLPCVAAP